MKPLALLVAEQQNDVQQLDPIMAQPSQRRIIREEPNHRIFPSGLHDAVRTTMVTGGDIRFEAMRRGSVAKASTFSNMLTGVSDKRPANTSARLRHDTARNTTWPRNLLRSDGTPKVVVPRPDKLPPVSWERARETLKQWADLPADWDDDGAPALSRDMVQAMESFIVCGEDHRISEPKLSIHSDGEVAFHWEGSRRAAVSFLLEGRFLAFVPREAQEPIRVSGPFDIATASKLMFDALAKLN